MFLWRPSSEQPPPLLQRQQTVLRSTLPCRYWQQRSRQCNTEKCILIRTTAGDQSSRNANVHYKLTQHILVSAGMNDQTFAHTGTLNRFYCSNKSRWGFKRRHPNKNRKPLPCCNDHIVPYLISLCSQKSVFTLRTSSKSIFWLLASKTRNTLLWLANDLELILRNLKTKFLYLAVAKQLSKLWC